MNPIASNDDFKAAIKNYATAKGFHGPVELAKELARPLGTVEQWFYTGLGSERGRRSVVGKYPQLFADGTSMPSDSATKALPEHSPQPQNLHDDHAPDRKIAVAVKTEVARGEVAALSKRLEWFLYKATPAERDQFRDTLGEDWKRFLELTRAMTGETAFRLAKEEGRLP